METMTRPASGTTPSARSSRFDIGPAPASRSIAEGLQTEQEERRQGMPFAYHPTNYSLSNPEAEHFGPTGRPTQALAAPGAPTPRALRPTPPSPPLRWQDVLGTGVSALTNIQPGAETGETDLGRQVETGTKELTTPGKRFTGALRTAEAGTEAMTPFMGPAALENPAAIARGLAEGEAASHVAGYVANKAGATPEQKELLESLSFWAPGVARSVIDPRVGIESSPEGTRAAATVAGGKAGAGVAVTPEGVTVRGKVGPFEGSKTFSRGAAPAGAGLEPPTIEGETPPPPPPDTAALTVLQYDNMQRAAGNLANGLPATPPPPAPPPMPEITPEQIQAESAKIAQLPKEQRAEAMLKAHEELSKALLQQGKLVVDGKLEIVRKPEQAEALAQRMINDEVTRIDKAASEGGLAKGELPQRFQPITPEAQPQAKTRNRKAQAEELAAKAAKVSTPAQPTPQFEVTQEPPSTVEASENAQPGESEPATQEKTAAPTESPKEPEKVAPAATEAKAPFEKGAPVSFARNMQVSKGEGKSEIIKAGTKAFVEHSDPNLNFARVRFADGRVQSVPLRYLEAAKEEANAPENVSGTRPSPEPAKGTTAAAETARHGSGGEAATKEVAAGSEAKAEVSNQGEPFALTHPPEDVGVRQYINSLPEHHQEYAQTFYDTLRDEGREAAYDLEPRVFGIPEKEMADVEKIDAKLHELSKAAGEGQSRVVNPMGPVKLTATRDSGKDIPYVERLNNPKAGEEQFTDTYRVEPGHAGHWEIRNSADQVAWRGKDKTEAKEMLALFREHPDTYLSSGYTRHREFVPPGPPKLSDHHEWAPLAPEVNQKLQQWIDENPDKLRWGHFSADSFNIKTPDGAEVHLASYGGKYQISSYKEPGEYSGSYGGSTMPKGKVAKSVAKLVKGIKGPTPAKPEGGAPAAKEEKQTKFKFGNTQANVPEDSAAGRALDAARERIADADLAGKGKDIGENHVTVRYGIQGDDTAGIRKFLAQQAPFEAKLGKTAKFPPSEQSDGAAVIIAPIEAPELHKLNAQLEKHGDFTEPSFKEYKPHATIAYVDPKKADRYVGMKLTEGKSFTIDEIGITDRNGNAEMVKLEGKKAEEAPAADTLTVKSVPGGFGIIAPGGKILQRFKSKVKAENELAKQKEEAQAKLEATPERLAQQKAAVDKAKELVRKNATNLPAVHEEFHSLANAAHLPELEPAKLRGKDTAHVYQVDGKWTPEREALHKQRVDLATKGKPEQTNPTLVILGGGAASGKGTITDAMKHDFPNAVINDVDEEKFALPEWETLLKSDPLRAAGRVHEESSAIGKMITARALEQRNDLILDGVAGKPEKIRRLIKEFTEKGYKVEAHFIDARIDKAVNAMIARYERNGRFINPSTMHEGHIGAAKVYHAEIVPNVPEHTLHVNHHETVNGEKQPPELIHKNGKVYNEDEFGRHLEKGGQTNGRPGSGRQLAEDAEGSRAEVSGNPRTAEEGRPQGSAETSKSGPAKPEGAGENNLNAGQPTERPEVSGVPRPAGQPSAGLEPKAGEGVREEGNVPAVSGSEGQPGGGATPARGGERPGDRSGRSGAGDVSRGGENAGGRGVREAPKLTRRNTDWFSHPEEFSLNAGTTTRLNWNLKALDILKRVESGESKLTDEDRDALAHFVGWGALQWAFNYWKAPQAEWDKFRAANQKLRELLTPEQMAAAEATVLNAHYTSPQIARFSWDVAKRLGFKGGTVLESSMGAGIFLGTMPKGLRGSSQMIGNELDPITYGVAKLLYPSATLFNKDFVQLVLPDNSIDLSVGNVPFGEEIYDPHYPKLKARIHDYFIVKTLDKLRPGGVAALITSTGTLDKPSERIREVMASKADLIFAVRFPAGTFEKSAGTHVTTDLLVFQKRSPAEPPGGEAFTKVVPVEAMHEQDKVMAKDYLNEYYDKHPENLLGELRISRRMYGSNDLVLAPKPGENLPDQLKEALSRVPRNVFGPEESTPLSPATSDPGLSFSPGLVEGNYDVKGGKVIQVRNGVNTPVKLEGKQLERMKKLVKLRDMLNETRRTMATAPVDDLGNALVKDQQKKLLAAYEDYRKLGSLNDAETKKVFGDDPHYHRLLALETYNKRTKAVKIADIFTTRTIYPQAKLSSLSADPKEAVYQVLNERGTPDLKFMATLSDKTEPELLAELSKAGLVFKDPTTNKYYMGEEYLSGYVREKLKDAQAAVEQGQKEYEVNVKALEKVIPPDKPIDRIRIRPGATWIPTEAIDDFLKDVFRAGQAVKTTNEHGVWSVDGAQSSAEIIDKYATKDFNGLELLRMALNLRRPTVYDIHEYVDEEGNRRERRVVNQQKTIAAREKQERITEEFQSYFRGHKEWAPQLVRQFNDKLNGLVPPKSDGSHLTFPGANMNVLRGGDFMAHQKNGIWRAVQNGRGLIATAVGGGKTYMGVAIGAESKRLGLARKPMYVVPNHTLGQWGRSWSKLYPASNVLIIGKEDFKPDQRKAQMARIMTNDWDAVVVPFSHFNLMDISAKYQQAYFQRQMDELRETLEGLEGKGKEGDRWMSRSERRQHSVEDKARKRTVKQLQKAMQNLKAKIAKLADLKSDKTVNFDDLGVDMLIVDEAHDYKNLLYYTKMGQVAGLQQTDAKKSTRLKMKTDYLQDRNSNRGVVFLTGTPISNTMAEMYTMTKYIAPDVLENAGIRYFDDWAANFGSIITANELSADSRTYRPRAKFAKFVNVPELQQLFRSFADVKRNEDMPEVQAILPKLKAGKHTVVEIENPELKPITNALVRRAAALRGEAAPVYGPDGKQLEEEYTDDKGRKRKRLVTESLPRPKPEEDNMLNIVNEGRMAAVDMRLLNPELSGKYSKIPEVIKQTVQRYKDSKATKGTQLIFCDRYRYVDADGKERFSIYKELVNGLAEAGIPKKEIAIVHDYDKDDEKLAMFDEVKAGKIRVLIGSTQKMGTGMNVQNLLVAEHHVDYPWKPAEMEQREGRIIRQGNQNKEIEILRYATKESFDSYIAQLLEDKAKFIWQVLSGKDVGDEIVDEAGDAVLSFAELKAIASGNPDVKRKMDLEQQVRKYEILDAEAQSEIAENTGKVRSERDLVARFEGATAEMQRFLDAHQKAVGEDKKFSLEILGEKFAKREDAMKWLQLEPVPKSNIHITLNGVPVVIEPKLHSDYSAKMKNVDLPEEQHVHEGDLASVEYRMPYDIPYKEYGRSGPEAIVSLASGRYGTQDPTLASAVRGIESVLRGLPKNIEDMRAAIKFREDRIKDLEDIQKNRPASSNARKIAELKTELDEVNKRLGIDVFADAEAQDVAADADGATPEGEEGGQEIDRSGERGSVSTAGLVELPIAAVHTVYSAAKRVKDFLKTEVEDNRRAKEMQWDLYDLDKRHEGRVLRAKQMLEQLQHDGLTLKDREAIDSHLDALEADSDNVPVPALTPEQDDILDRVLMPMRAEAEKAFKKVTEAGLTIPNYNPRQTKGRGGMLDRFLQPEGEKRTGRGNMLSQSMPAAKRRVMMALENGDKRVVVSIKNGEVVAWRNGATQRMGPLEAPKGKKGPSKEREFEDKHGNIWKIVQATKAEIEANTPVRYYHDAAASTIVNWLQAKKAEAAHDFLESVKESPDFKEIAVKTDAGNPPSGWRTTNLPQFKGYYFEPHTAEVLDWFADRLKSGSPSAFDSINQYMRMKILLNPIKHPLNVAAQWAVQRGVTGFLPTRFYRLGKTGARAINAVVNQNKDLRDALEAGAPLQSARGVTKDLAKLFYDTLGEATKTGQPWATKLAKSIGLAPVELVKALHKLSSKIAWPASDILFLQAAYEYQEAHPDATLHDALREVGRIIPEYRLPTRILNSTAVAKAMSSNIGTVFGSYHYGLLRSFGESAKSALGMAENAPGRSTAEEVAKGWDRLALMALVAFGLYGIADQLAKKLTKEKDAQVQRHGIFGLIQAAVDVAHHDATPTQAITKVFTPNPTTVGLGQLIFNRDVQSGRHIYDPAADWHTEGTQLMRYLREETIPQEQEIERAQHRDEGWKKFGLNQLDVNFRKRGAERLAQEIASSKMDTSAWTPEDREKYYARQRALEGLRKGSGKALEEGVQKGLLSIKDLSKLMHRSMHTEFQDKINGFSYAEVRRVYDRAVEDKDEEAQKQILPILLEKQIEILGQVPETPAAQ